MRIETYRPHGKGLHERLIGIRQSLASTSPNVIFQGLGDIEKINPDDLRQPDKFVIKTAMLLHVGGITFFFDKNAPRQAQNPHNTHTQNP